MVEKMRRPLAAVAFVVGVLMLAAGAGPDTSPVLGWGPGLLIGVVLVVGAWVVLTDRRPAHMRQRRPYDFERDTHARWR